MCVAKRNWHGTRRSIVHLQASVRCFVQHRKYLRLRKAVVKMQRRRRASELAVRQCYYYKYMRGACIMIQSQIRGFLTRLHLKKLQTAACTIQCAYKCYRDFTTYNKVKKSVLIIQRYWRAVQSGRRQQAIYRQIKTAVVFLQSKVRRHQAAKKAKIQTSATIIQAYYKMYKQRKCYVELRQAVVFLQAQIRCKNDRKQFIQLKAAVHVLQTHYRSWKIMTSTRMNFQRMKTDVIRIQALFRGNKERKYFLKLKVSVICMQANIRGKRERIRFLELKISSMVLQERYRALVKMRRCYMMYHHQRRVIIVLQSTVRSWIVCRKYKAIRAANIRLQAAIRGYIQKQRFQCQKAATVCLQLHFRAWRKGRMQQKEYLLQRSSAIAIQSAFRQYALRKQRSRVKAIILIQAHYRGYWQRRVFVEIIKSAIIIQSFLKCWMVRRRYLRLKNATEVIQRRYKSWMESRECQRRYQVIQIGVKRLQALVRGHRVRKELCRQRSALRIQAWFRMCVAKRNWHGTRRSIVHLQALVKGWHARKKFKRLRVQHRAAVCLQRHFKTYILLRRIKVAQQLRTASVRRFTAAVFCNLAAIRIQRQYRCHMVLLAARKKIVSLIIIQRWIRYKLQRIHYIKLRRGVIALQRAVRLHQQRRNEAAINIQSFARMYLAKQRIKKINSAAILIQTLWRGYDVRKKMTSKKLRKICGRCKAANEAVTEDKKLCNRTATALDYVMKYKQMSNILEALCNLDVVTRLSPVCCEQLVAGKALPIIFVLIKNCNRSLPCMEVVKYCISILTNLAKYSKTCSAVYEVPNSINHLMELIQMYREKTALFVKICNLLVIFCLDSRRAKEIRSMARVAEKIQSIHKLTGRRHKLAVQRTIVKNRSMNCSAFNLSSQSFGATFVCETPSIRRFTPDWELKSGMMGQIDDPLQVTTLLMNLLQLKPK